MFNNQFIFFKIKFLIFLKFFLIGIGYGSGSGIPDTRRVWGWDEIFKPVGYRVRGQVGDWENNTRPRPPPLPCLVQLDSTPITVVLFYFY